MRVWRLCRKKHAEFDGEGARLAGGRWNRRGTAVVYTSATLSLAILEHFVNLKIAGSPADLAAIPADIPEDVLMTSVDVSRLPRDWRKYPAPETLAELGTAWVERGESAVLAVPSAVVSEERNYLLNPAHAQFHRIRIGKPVAFRLDSRM